VYLIHPTIGFVRGGSQTDIYPTIGFVRGGAQTDKMGERILVVDDESDVCFVLKEVLSEMDLL